MKHWKRHVISLLLTAALLVTPAAAYQLQYLDGYWEGSVHTQGLNNDPDRQAQMLKELGLFQGTGGDFALDRNMTRAEAAAMLVRLLGAEEQALAQPQAHPFTDVPAWASPYVGWLHQNGLTKGISQTQYGAASRVTLQQYATFLARALHGKDVPDTAWSRVASEDERQYLDVNNAFFYRAAAVGLSVRALQLEYTVDGVGKTLAAHLVDQGAFTAQQLADAAFTILPSQYETDADGTLWRVTAGVRVAACPEKGYVPVAGSTGLDRDSFFATRAEADGGIGLAILDCLDMTVLQTARYAGKGVSGLSYIGAIGDADYLAELVQIGTDTCYGALLRWDGSTLKPVWSAQELWAGEPVKADDGFRLLSALRATQPWEKPLERIVAVCADKLLILDQAGERSAQWPVGAKLIEFDGMLVVGVKPEEAGATTVFSVDTQTGKLAQSYTVAPLETDAEGKPVRRGELGGHRLDMYYGDAGGYEIVNGALRQVTARPVLDYTWTRWGAGGSDPFFLTYTPGVYLQGPDGRAGDEVFSVNDAGEENVFFSAASNHGIVIDSFGPYGDSLLLFCSKHANGDVYTYLAWSGNATANLTLDYITSDVRTISEEELQSLLTAERTRLRALGLYNS